MHTHLTSFNVTKILMKTDQNKCLYKNYVMSQCSDLQNFNPQRSIIDGS